MKDYDYTYWFLAIIIVMYGLSYKDSMYRQDIIKELREIKMELKK